MRFVSWWLGCPLALLVLLAGYAPNIIVEDVNGDGAVDPNDIELVADAWHTAVYDLNSDGITNVQDIEQVASAMSNGAATATTTPAPTATVQPVASKKQTVIIPPNDLLGTPYGFDFGTTRQSHFAGQAFKLSSWVETYWHDAETGLTGGLDGWWNTFYISRQGEFPDNRCAGADPLAWDTDCLAYHAYQHPQQWWIIGEEPNTWNAGCDAGLDSAYNGVVCQRPSDGYPYPSPEIYARWVYQVVHQVRRGWEAAGGSEAGIVGFYFMQDDQGGSDGCRSSGTYTPTLEYMERFLVEWELRGYGEQPFDALYFLHFPPCSSAGAESPAESIDKSVAYWQGKREEIDTTGFAGLPMWVETLRGSETEAGEPCAAARRLVNYIEWANATDWIGRASWFASFVAGYDLENLYTDSIMSVLSLAGQTFRDEQAPDVCHAE